MRVEAVERPQRVQPRPPVRGAAPASFARSGDHRLVAALDEQLLRGVAPPAVRVRQRCHQLRAACASPARASVSRSRRLVHDAIDAAEPGRPFELVRHDVIAQVLRDVGALLDHAAIHVDDVERAVGGVGQEDRPEALVGGGEELRLVVGLARPQRPAVVARGRCG